MAVELGKTEISVNNFEISFYLNQNGQDKQTNNKQTKENQSF